MYKNFKKKHKINLSFNLEIIKKILDTNEDQLKKQGWSYGILTNNRKLNLVRTMIGNPEKVAGNYFRKYAGESEAEVMKLREVKLVNTVAKLINGDKVGYECGKDVLSGKGESEGEIFEECRRTPGGDRDKMKVNSVLKAVLPNLAKQKVPTKESGGAGHQQKDASKEGSKIYSDDFDRSKVISEKCERDYGWGEVSGWGDLEKKIRQ